MNEPKPEFQEIGHSGGSVIFCVVTEPDGRRSYQVRYEQCRPCAMRLVILHALPQGVAVGEVQGGGIGTPWNSPPVPGCYPVFMASDSQGRFGHECPACNGYWRSEGMVWCCPYCGVRADRIEFLTRAQEIYIAQYCARLAESLDDPEDAEHVIDMDAVADAAGRDAQKPPFYYAEEIQQHQYACRECGRFNDILGRFGYCTSCGTRNDLQILECVTLPLIRERINTGDQYEACARDAVSAFDSCARQYARQLAACVPMRPRRRTAFEKMLFHNLDDVAVTFLAAFDIDLLSGFGADDATFMKRMFHRRHVYEHNGGEADTKYIQISGDLSIRPKQLLRETRETVHRLVGLVAKSARNLHQGFHDILPTNQPMIDDYARRREIMKRHGGA